MERRDVEVRIVQEATREPVAALLRGTLDLAEKWSAVYRRDAEGRLPLARFAALLAASMEGLPGPRKRAPSRSRVEMRGRIAPR